MTSDLIRRLDAVVGTPLCAALTLLRRLGDILKGSRATPPPRSILFIKMTEQGAIVLAAGAIRKAIEMVGRENVYFLIFGENRAILDLLELIPPEHVFPVKTGGLFAFAADILRTLAAIRRLRIDATVDLEFFSRASAILGYLSGARIRSGHHGFTRSEPWRGDLLTHRVNYNPHVHTAIGYAELVEALAADPQDVPLLKMRAEAMGYALAPPRFEPKQGERDRVHDTLARVAGHRVEGPLILLNPNASDLIPIRKWPGPRFVELGRRLLEAFPAATIVITGQRHEADAARVIAGDISPDRCVCMAGETTLRELLVLYTLSELMVTNDSGPPHFAAMTPMDVIVMFGPETPRLFGPLGDHVHLLSAGLACSPCVSAYNFRQSPCRNNKCMQDISVDEVFDTATRILAERCRR